MRLTERDYQILRAVSLHGYLTTELIGLAFFPSAAAARDRASSKAYERTRTLWLWGLLERVELPTRVLGGRRPSLYTLGPRAMSALGPVPPGLEPLRRRRRARGEGLFIAHELTVARFWAHLIALLRSTPVHLARWVPERELRARRRRVKDPRSGRWLPVLPDAYFELAYPDGATQCCVLEVDLGTLTLARFRRKLRAFELSLAGGLFARDWGQATFEGLVVTHSPRRLEHLWAAARREVAEARWPHYSLATLDALHPARFGQHVWSTLEEDAVPLLYDLPASDRETPLYLSPAQGELP